MVLLTSGGGRDGAPDETVSGGDNGGGDWSSRGESVLGDSEQNMIGLERWAVSGSFSFARSCACGLACGCLGKGAATGEEELEVRPVGRETVVGPCAEATSEQRAATMAEWWTRELRHDSNMQPSARARRPIGARQMKMKMAARSGAPQDKSNSKATTITTSTRRRAAARITEAARAETETSRSTKRGSCESATDGQRAANGNELSQVQAELPAERPRVMGDYCARAGGLLAAGLAAASSVAPQSVCGRSGAPSVDRTTTESCPVVMECEPVASIEVQSGGKLPSAASDNKKGRILRADSAASLGQRQWQLLLQEQSLQATTSWAKETEVEQCDKEENDNCISQRGSQAEVEMARKQQQGPVERRALEEGKSGQQQERNNGAGSIGGQLASGEQKEEENNKKRKEVFSLSCDSENVHTCKRRHSSQWSTRQDQRENRRPPEESSSSNSVPAERPFFVAQRVQQVRRRKTVASEVEEPRRAPSDGCFSSWQGDKLAAPREQSRPLKRVTGGRLVADLRALMREKRPGAEQLPASGQRGAGSGGAKGSGARAMGARGWRRYSLASTAATTMRHQCCRLPLVVLVLLGLTLASLLATVLNQQTSAGQKHLFVGSAAAQDAPQVAPARSGAGPKVQMAKVATTGAKSTQPVTPQATATVQNEGRQASQQRQKQQAASSQSGQQSARESDIQQTSDASGPSSGSPAVQGTSSTTASEPAGRRGTEHATGSGAPDQPPKSGQTSGRAGETQKGSASALSTSTTTIAPLGVEVAGRQEARGAANEQRQLVMGDLYSTASTQQERRPAPVEQRELGSTGSAQPQSQLQSQAQSQSQTQTQTKAQTQSQAPSGALRLVSGPALEAGRSRGRAEERPQWQTVERPRHQSGWTKSPEVAPWNEQPFGRQSAAGSQGAGQAWASAKEQALVGEAVRSALSELALAARPASGAGSGATQHNHFWLAPLSFGPGGSGQAAFGPLASGRNKEEATRQGQQFQSVASQSAPSVSLPPISHLLSPRNPFKLFASASAPISTRYWQHVKVAQQKQNQQQAAAQEERPRFVARWLPFGGGSSGRASSKASQQQQQQQQQYQQQQQQQLPSASSNSLATSSLAELGEGGVLAALAAASSASASAAVAAEGPTVYAHSHSAEQLEQLVRAASQAGHLPRNQPPILAAIVSGPDGRTFPGYYIPAIEQQPASSPSTVAGHQSQESRLNEHFLASNSLGSLAAGSLAAASSLPSAAEMLSKIPGTDYVLHPEEVRAMMNIGELAWRKRLLGADGQQQAAASEQYVPAASTANWLANEQQQSHNELGPLAWHFGGQHQAGGLMEENHLENARNYAYVDHPQTSPGSQGGFSGSSASGGPGSPSGQSQLHAQQPQDKLEQLRGSHSQPEPVGSRPGGGNQAQLEPSQHTNGSSSSLQSSLARHLARARLDALPALIRVNDQDYVHWPLIQLGAKQQQLQQPQESAALMFVSPSSAASSIGPTHQAAAAPLRELAQRGGTGHLGASEVRLRTQLTPSEIRQVEESILETLMLSQSVEQQHRMAAALRNMRLGQHAADSKLHMEPLRTAATQHRWPRFRLQPGQQASPGARGRGSTLGGFLLGRRRRQRRRRNSPASSGQAKHYAAAPAQQSVPVGATSGLVAGDLHPTGSASSEQRPAQAGLLVLPSSLASFASDQLAQDEVPAGGSSTPLQSTTDSAQSKMGHPLPVLLADQEGSRMAAVSVRPEQQSSSLVAESSAPQATVLGRSWAADERPAPTGQLTNGLAAGGRRDAGRQLFGARLNVGRAAGQSSTPEVATGAGQSSQGTASSSKQAEGAEPHGQSTSRTSSLAAPQAVDRFITFVPMANNRDRQISMYTSGGAPKPASAGQWASPWRPSGETATLAASPRGQRISVDWPTITSDSDYFPQQPKEGASPHRNPSGGGRSETAPTGAHASLQAPTTSRLFGSLPGPQVPRLQFAPDYQTREGVPIYNNNVRLTTVIDRHGSPDPPRVPSLSASRTASHETGSGDASDDYNYEESALHEIKPNGRPKEQRQGSTADSKPKALAQESESGKSPPVLKSESKRNS